jgi:hypothetical protein
MFGFCDEGKGNSPSAKYSFITDKFLPGYTFAVDVIFFIFNEANQQKRRHRLDK